MFRTILHANDGSEHAFQALALALAIARQNNSELHMVSVAEIDYMPEFIEEVRLKSPEQPFAVSILSCSAPVRWRKTTR